MKIALIGADGQLGSDLLPLLAGEQTDPLYFPSFDITRGDPVRNLFRETRPEVVINTAAFHRVDECEEKVEEAYRVNAFAVRDLARVCLEIEAVLVHFSTDYVFDGQKGEPYVETDCPSPLSVYGASKLAGEQFVRSICPKSYVIRTCGLYGKAGCREKGRNFVEAMISLEQSGRSIRVVNDQWVTPTSSRELAARTAELIRTGQYGLFHMTNEGWCTWYEFARTIFDLLGKKPRLVPVETAAFGAKAKRPAYSVLENARAKAIGLQDFSPWTDALRNYLKEKGLASGG
jgi:dTDP-4-dehydrorhamnose reductase